MKKKIFVLILLGGLVAILITCKCSLREKNSRNTSLRQTDVTYDTITWNEFLLTHKVENADNIEAHIKNQFVCACIICHLCGTQATKKSELQSGNKKINLFPGIHS